MDRLLPLLGGAPQPVTQEVETQIKSLLDGVTTPEAAQSRLYLAQRLLGRHPNREDLQVATAQLMELTREAEHMLDTWAGLHKRFPKNQLALRMSLRWLARAGRSEDGTALLNAAFDQPGITLTDQLLEADLFAEIKDHDASDARYRALIARYPDQTQPKTAFAKRLYLRGQYWEAGKIVAQIDPKAKLSPAAEQLCQDIITAVGNAKTIPDRAVRTSSVPSAALYMALSSFHGRRTPTRLGAAMGGIAFVTGSLGAGGAERQMTRIASALHKARQSERDIAGLRLGGEIEVIVTRIDPANGKDFYKPVLDEAGVSLSVLAEMTPEPLVSIGLGNPELEQIAAVLPQKTQYGLSRLVSHFRATRPEVAYLWQDGSGVTAALAALVAGVPRIVMSLRGLPPNLRPEMMREEYEDMYRALADVPGVIFSANSRIAADAYADWLSLPRDRFDVIPNAVEPLPSDGKPASRALFRDFTASTGPSSFTLGTVMRFTPNKRPGLWVEAAIKLSRALPDARFIMVGDGQGVTEARAKARAAGLSDRILFTGASDDVGFWLAQMDAFLLLSEFEGLPNVLIEAQIAGVPVISTPAGGATETFEDCVTGLTLSTAEAPASAEVVQKLLLLARQPDLRARMSAYCKSDIAPRYALDRVLEQTVSLLSDQNGDHHVDAPVPMLLTTRAG